MNKNFAVHPEQRKSSILVTDWPFSWVRNPIYLAGLTLCLGWSISFYSYYSLIGTVLLTFILLIKIKYEEFYLTKQFGNSYLEYKNKVPKLFPSIF